MLIIYGILDAINRFQKIKTYIKISLHYQSLHYVVLKLSLFFPCISILYVGSRFWKLKGPRIFPLNMVKKNVYLAK